MRILWIHSQNFKCYENLRVPDEGILPQGLIFVEGENSAGKSSLVDSILYAFFYHPVKSKYLGVKEDLIRRGQAETRVEIGFELDGKYYALQRFHSKKKSVDARFLELEKGQALEGKVKSVRNIAEGAEDVDSKIESMLNIDRESVLRTLVVRQGEVQQLAEAKGAELRDLIYQLFELDEYKDKLKEIVKNKVDHLEDEITKRRIFRESENIQEEIDQIDNNIEQIKENIVEIEENIGKLEKQIEKYPKISELQQIRDFTKEIQVTEENISKLEKTFDENSVKHKLSKPITEDAVNRRISEYEKDVKNLREIEKSYNNIRDAIIAGLASLQKDLKTFEKQKNNLDEAAHKEGEPFKCDVCEQEMSGESYNALYKRLARNIPNLQKGIQNKKLEIRKKDEELLAFATDIQVKNRHLENVKHILSINHEKKEYEEKKESYGKKLSSALKRFDVKSSSELSKKYAVQNFNDFYDKINELTANQKRKEQEKIFKEDSINEKTFRKEDLEKQIIENTKKEREQQELRGEIGLIKQVENFVSGFISEDLISNRLLAGIQESTNSNIYLFTRGKYSNLFLESTKTKTLNMSIKDEEDGFVKRQTMLSGGDKAAIGLGLRIGISDLLKRIRPLKDSPYEPPRMDIMILDEPLGSLDDERRTRVIEGLLAQDKFSQIFLITHTNIRQKLDAPMILVESTSSGNKATFFASPSKIEQESEG